MLTLLASFQIPISRQSFAGDSVPADRTIVLQVSWIIPDQGISELLQTARAVLLKTDKVQFVFVGEEAYREQYMKEARQLGLGDS